MCLWEVSYYTCLRETTVYYVTKFMKYIVHGWDARCWELSMRNPSCDLSFFINELQYFSRGCFPFWSFTTWNVGVKWCHSLCDYLNLSLNFNINKMHKTWILSKCCSQAPTLTIVICIRKIQIPQCFHNLWWWTIWFFICIQINYILRFSSKPCRQNPI